MAPTDTSATATPEVTITTVGQIGPAIKKHRLRWRDLVGFFILGILSDTLPGFFFTNTIEQALDLPPDNPQAPLALSADLGGLVGVLFTTFVQSHFRPELRVLVNAALQLLGLVLTWQLPYPSNMVGIAILTIGFQGMLNTILPLTVYKPETVTDAYQFGFAVAPILGAAIVNAGSATDIGSTGLFSIATCWPIIVFLAFFFVIDRSPWRQGGFWNFFGNSQSIKFPEDIVARDIELQRDVMGEETHDAESVMAQNEPVKFDSAALVCHEHFDAVCQVGWVYFPFWIVAMATNQWWQNNLQIPFLTTIVTGAGLDPQMTEDAMVLVGHVGVLFVGLAVVVPYMGPFLSHSNGLFLWIPTVIQLAFVVTATIALYGFFQSLPSVIIGYLFQIFIAMTVYYVMIFAPINLRDDKKLTPRYMEFQIQTLQIIQQVTWLIIDLVSIFWASPFFYQACKAHLQSAHTNVSCDYYSK